MPNGAVTTGFAEYLSRMARLASANTTNQSRSLSYNIRVGLSTGGTIKGVAGVYDDAPASQTALRSGDVILEVGGHTVHGLAGLFRSVWAQGAAGCEIPLTLQREGRSFEVRIASVDRRDFWRAPDLH